jgi:hypothetical protein
LNILDKSLNEKYNILRAFEPKQAALEGFVAVSSFRCIFT